MRKFSVPFLALVLVLMTGCGGVASLHPLAMSNEKVAVFDPALLGTWTGVDPDGDGAKERYVVTRAESGYLVTADSPEQKAPTQLPTQLFKVGDRYLLDIDYPSDGPPAPVHVFFKLRLDNDTAWLAEMDSDWLVKQIKARDLPRHAVLAEDHDRIVLTASPSELRNCLLPYVADDRSFGEETELRRIK